MNSIHQGKLVVYECNINSTKVKVSDFMHEIYTDVSNL